MLLSNAEILESILKEVKRKTQHASYQGNVFGEVYNLTCLDLKRRTF